MTELEYFYDDKGHLVCIPYSLENLNRMAADLSIKKCWLEKSNSGYWHYDMPFHKKKFISLRATLVSRSQIFKICTDNAYKQQQHLL